MLSFMRPANKPVVEGLETLEITFAANQPQYNPLRTIRGRGEACTVLSRWTLTPEQRQAVAGGGDIYLELSTFRDKQGRPNPLQPIRMAVGENVDPDYIRAEYGLADSNYHASPGSPDTERPR